LLNFRSLRDLHFELKRDLVKEFQLKKSSRYKEIKRSQLKILSIGPESREDGGYTSSRKVKIKVP
jgi:hypothetical protein